MPGVRTAFLLGHHGCWLELRLWPRGKQPLRVRAGVVMKMREVEYVWVLTTTEYAEPFMFHSWLKVL
jgi:hypothetical protein